MAIALEDRNDCGYWPTYDEDTARAGPGFPMPNHDLATDGQFIM
jgi:hypothetical protein